MPLVSQLASFFSSYIFHLWWAIMGGYQNRYTTFKNLFESWKKSLLKNLRLTQNWDSLQARLKGMELQEREEL